MSGQTVSIIAVVAFVLSALSFIGAQLSASRGSHVSAIDRCQDDLEDARKEVERLQARNVVLQEENFALMRKIISGSGP